MPNTLKMTLTIGLFLIFIDVYCQERIFVISNFGSTELIDIDYEFFVKKGKWSTNLEDRLELKMYNDDVRWTNSDILKLKRGNVKLKFRIIPIHSYSTYTIKFTNTTLDYSKKIVIDVYPYEVTKDQLVDKELINIYKDSDKINNRLKIPLFYDFCYVKLLSLDKENEYYNREFGLPDYPYLDYNNIEPGIYVLSIITYNASFETNISILNFKE